jgi:hypothetical protein
MSRLRIPWVPIRILQVVLRRALKGRSIWEWHHHQMTSNDPYARILIQGVVKALWQKHADRALVLLAKTVIELARYLKKGKYSIE